MSISTIEVALDRIAFATEDSPIAVFRSTITGQVNTMFANTVRAQERIRNNDPMLIGVFDATMNMRHVAKQLLDAVHESVTVDIPIFVKR